MLKIYQKPFIQEITEPWMLDKGLQLFIKREDVIHPFVSGNKWRKLKYNLEAAKAGGHDSLLTFGGAYSNHIYATSAAAAENGFKAIGIIRGEELAEKPRNPTLQFAEEQGMQLHFVTREDYRSKTSQDFVKKLREKFGKFYLIPEGGTNQLAINGASEIMEGEVFGYDYICSSVGTGGTLAGIAVGAQSFQQIVGFSVLKGSFLKDEVEKHLQLYNSTGKNNNWSIINNYHFGGYAKTTPELLTFMNEFEKTQQILLDPIYTAKMMFGIYDMIRKNKFSPGKKILAIHTGGLQGRFRQ